jgi:peptidoglycan/xylan/chitin deacetylase (PgdA/CDA1 family)
MGRSARLGVALSLLVLFFALAFGPLGNSAAAAVPGFRRGIVTMTFDDSWSSQYANALPALNSHGIKGTVYTVTGFIDSNPSRMTTRELSAFRDSGHEIASHQVSHEDPTTLSHRKLIAELADSKEVLEPRFGPVHDYASPFGTYNDTTIAAIKQYYRSQRTVDDGYNTAGNLDVYRLKVKHLFNTTTPADVAGWIQQAKAARAWLILVYHQVDDTHAPYGVTPHDFAAHCAAVEASGLPGETVNQALDEIQPTSTWYLAEGTTDFGFNTFINIENPNPQPVTARVTYMSANGPMTRPDTILPASSVTTINAADDLGKPVDFSTRVMCPDGLAIAVDRTMTWPTGHGTDVGEHNSIGVTAPSSNWFFAEGSSAWGFEFWLLVQNPNPQTATARVTYMIEGGGQKTVTHQVPAHSRATFNMADDIGPGDSSIKVDSDLAVIAERSMYTHWASPETGTLVRREGHVSIGTVSPSLDYYLAEGSTAWGFTTYVLIQNPNYIPANATLTPMSGNGALPVRHITVPARSRQTVRLNDAYPSLDLATRVHSDVSVVVERAMYWGSPAVPDSGSAMHCSIGSESPHKIFYLPDGRVTAQDGGTDTFTLVDNPNTADVSVRVFYLTASGTNDVVFTDTVAAGARKTYSMSDKLSEARAGIVVECVSGQKIVVERSIYAASRWAGSSTVGAPSDGYAVPR